MRDVFGWQIFRERRTCAYNSTLADRDILDNARTGANVHIRSRGYATAKNRPWRYMIMRANKAVMLDNSATVDNGVIADVGASLNNGASHYLYAPPQCCVR